MLDLLGVRYLALSDPEQVKTLEDNGFTLAFREDKEGMALFENPDAFPRAFAVTACKVAGEGGNGDDDARKEALEWVTANDFEPRAYAILEEPPPEGFSTGAESPPANGKKPEVTIDKYTPLSIRVNVHMHQQPGFLVLTDVHYPGWEAMVNGKPVPILRADYAFRAVTLEEGIHTVEFTYKPDSRKLGIVASGFSLGLVLLWGLALLLMRFIDGRGSVVVLGAEEVTGEENFVEAGEEYEGEEEPLEKIRSHTGGVDPEVAEEGLQEPGDPPGNFQS
jgi:hypothetical protein